MLNFINIGIIVLIICYGSLLGVTGNSRYTIWKMNQCTEKSVRLLNHLFGAGLIFLAIGMAVASVGLREYGNAEALILICTGGVVSWLAIAANITLFIIVPKKRKG